ncbi:MAG: MMPL family transporter [Nevskia sp.]
MSLRARFIGWTAVVALLIAVFAIDVRPHFRLETDILALLPNNDVDPVEDRALDRFSDLIGRNAVWLIGDPDFAKARKAASDFAAALDGSQAFTKIRFELDTDWPEQASAGYLPYRDGLLSAALRAQLANGEGEAVLAHAREALYTPAAFLRRSAPGSDPLSLFGDFLSQATPNTGQASLREGVLTVVTAAAGGRPAMHYVAVSAVLGGNPFSTDIQTLATPAISNAIAAAKTDGATVTGSGLIQHAVAASRLARSEIALFGGIQLVGLVLILWWVFRSLRVLWLSAAALGVAVLAALTLSHYVFSALHVMTLVFCSNLAGIAIDYSIYYCADQFRTPGRWQPADALAQIGPAITMSCLAAVLSYALLAVAPFPGLRQMALFCCVGLAFAYGSVMGWFPALVKPAPAAVAERLSTHFASLQRLRDQVARLPLRIIALVLAVLTVIGITRLRFADDVRVLQPDTPALFAQEQQVRNLIGSVAEGRFYLVRGAREEDVLQREEQLRQRLDPLVAQGAMRSYTAVSRALPSAAQQAADHRLLAAKVYAPDGLAPRFMRELGFADDLIAQRLQAFAAATKPLSAREWLASPGSEPFQHLWLGDIGGGTWASIVTMAAIADEAAVAKAAEGLPGVRLVNRVAEVSDVLKRYRQRALLLVAIAAVASALLLAAAYGLARGFRLMAAPAAACLVTLAVFGWFGIAVTFFHVVALHLVTGLSMEYAILLMLPQWKGPATLLSATLAAVLAVLAFGLLAFSATPFIHSLGLTVTVGVLCGFAFAFASGTLRPTQSRASP